MDIQSPGDDLLDVILRNVKVNEILKKNETVIKRVYDIYTHSKKKFIRLDECRELVRKAGLNVSDM